VRPFLGWRIVLVCAVAQNGGMGLVFGSFGPLLTTNEQHFHVSRAVVSTAMSVLVLTLAGLSPVLGGMLQRMSIRAMMMAGAAVTAFAYCGLAIVTSFGVALVMYGLIGIGVCVIAILGPLAMVNRWYLTNRARMLSIVNLPICLFVTPSAVAALLPIYSRSGILYGVAGIFLLMVPLLWLLVDRPEQVGQLARGGDSPDQPDASVKAIAMPLLSTGAILRDPAFWFISVAVGIMGGSATAFVVHSIPFSMGKLMSLRQASAMLSVYAFSGIFGNLMMGWVADRIGPLVTLVLTSLMQALLWFGMLQFSGISLFAIAGLLGICVIPLVTLHGAALSELFGAANISRAMGFSYSVKLPFLLVFAPLLGLLFERTGSYDLPFLVTAGTLIVAGVSFFLALFASRKQRGILATAA
jgi:cyanate permease